MNSVFEIIGPPMIGPSSSHTAGAVRIGLMGRAFLGVQPTKAILELHGSFAATGTGHATDRGLVSGLLGFAPDDERLKTALDLARDSGLSLEFKTVDLGEQAHPNSARLHLEAKGADPTQIVASSIGGGSIEVVQVNGFPSSLTGALDALAIFHRDQPGFLSKVTTVLACVETNIATIRTSRHHRGEDAFTVVETDSPVLEDALGVIRRISNVKSIRSLRRLP